MFSSRFRWSLETNRLSRLLDEKRRAGTHLFDLTESNPTRAGFEYPTEIILSALAQPSAMLYEPAPKGLLAAREAVAAYYSERALKVEPARLHLTASTSEGYAYLFKLLCNDGDTVLVPQPSYPLFDFLAAMEGVHLRGYPLEYVHPRGWRIDFDALRAAIDEQTRAVIVVNPNNPTGSYLDGGDRRELLALCAARRLAIIADEVFGDYRWSGESPADASLVGSDEALTFVLSGLSKIVALPQMKLGWIATGGPELLVREATERLDLIADTYLSVSAPTQAAAEKWLGLREGLQSQILARVRANLAHLAGAVEGTSCRLLAAQGGWYATLEIPRHATEEELVLAMLAEDDVLIHPGYFFDFSREAFLVVSLLAPVGNFSEAVARMIRRLQ